MCDTLCAVGRGRTLFGKNSDRPPGEAQPVRAFPMREAGGLVRTQYTELDDPGARAMLGSQPDWLWGFEHGLNEQRVAIGNEAIYTSDDARSAPDELIGMDLVRLGLERSENADDALAVMTQLLERYGQGGVCVEETGERYFSSFLIADPRKAWVLETSGRTWAAKEIEDAAAISNRVTLREDWSRASGDVEPGADFDRWRDPGAPTGHADKRLAASTACLSRGAAGLGAADLVAHLRHHGERPWGAPGTAASDWSPPPTELLADGTGVTVCMHVRGLSNTTSSIVAELPEDPARPLRAWAALGSPCCSLYVPVFPPLGVPPELGDPRTWAAFAALRDRVEADGDTLGPIREALGPLETELWQEADEAAAGPGAREAFVASVWPRVAEALDRLS
jgi:secernin